MHRLVGRAWPAYGAQKTLHSGFSRRADGEDQHGRISASATGDRQARGADPRHGRGSDNVKHGTTKLDLARQLMEDMESFKQEQRCERLVMVWCGSTEVYAEPGAVHADLDAFERGLRENAAEIAPSQIYAYAALSCGVP